MRPTPRLVLVCAFALTLVSTSAGGARPHSDPQLVLLDVRVNDKAGNPVTALDREAFQLSVGGKPERLVSFKAVSGAAALADAASAEPGKIVMILFDVHAMDSSQATIAQRAAANYASRHMGPGDRVAVAVYGRNLQILQPFTGDRQKVLDAIGRPLAAFGSSKLEKGFGGAEGIQLAKNVLRSFRTLAAELASINARKSVLVFTQDFSAATGEEFSKLVEEARASRVSFYTLITTGAVARRDNAPLRARAKQRGPGTAWNSSGGFGQMSFSALAQQRGAPQTQAPTGPTGSGISDPSLRESVTALDAVTANKDILQNLAKETYGDVVREANNLNDALDAIDLRLSNYYLLGFLLDANRSAKTQKIEVKVNGKDLRVSYPKQYVPAGLNEEEDGFPLRKNLSSPLEAATPPTASATLTFRPVVLQAADEISKVVLFAGPAQLSARGPTVLLAVALDEANRPCARFESRLSPEQLQAPVHAALLLRPGAYRVRLALRDEKDWLSIGEQPVTVPPPAKGQLSAATLVISERVEALPESVRGLAPTLISEDHPLSFKGYRVVPALTNQAARQKPLALFFTLYNVKDTAATQLKSEPRLVNDAGEVFLLSPVQHLETAQAIGDHTVLLGFTISLASVKPSHYRLVLDTLDPLSKETVSSETEVVVQ